MNSFKLRRVYSDWLILSVLIGEFFLDLNSNFGNAYKEKFVGVLKSNFTFFVPFLCFDMVLRIKCRGRLATFDKFDKLKCISR